MTTRDAARRSDPAGRLPIGGVVRSSIPDIRVQLQKVLERREPLAATRVVTDADQYVVLTLAPRHAAHLLGRSGSAVWETRLYLAQPPRFGIGAQSHYVVLDATREDAVARHETLIGRLERGVFDHETSCEILRAICPWTDRAARAFAAADHQATVAALEEALGVAGRLDTVRRFLHLYVEVFLMRALTLELADRDAAKTAYRDFIALHAEHPLGHPETLRGVAWAREAIERLAPVPSGAVNREEVGMTPAGAERMS
jgi:hypothetical protein